MDCESNRRKTFNNWTNPPINLNELSQNGFYATGNSFETKCNWCSQIINDWTAGDRVNERHARLSANCPAVIYANNYNNGITLSTGLVPIIENNTHRNDIPSTSRDVLDTTMVINNQNQSGIQGPEVIPENMEEEECDMKNEKTRLATFKYWPNPNISPEALSKAGFYYINQSDQVKCAWCKGIIAKWEEGDNAFDEHQRFFPDCARVQLGPFIEINSASRDLGIQQMSAPKKPKFSCLDARLRSYLKWPIPDIQKPEILAQAGFYYQLVDDQVRCFHCNGGLRSWQKEDDPWFEHGKWFPHCHFLKLIKGPNYVNEVQDTCRTNNSDTINNTTNTIGSNSETVGEVSQPSASIISLDAAMSSSIVQRALEMGLNEGRVLNAVRRQLEFNGKLFDTTEELVEVVLESQVEEEDDNSELSSSIVREVSRILNNIFSPSDFENEIPSPSSEQETFISFTNLNSNGNIEVQISQSDSTLAAYNSEENIQTSIIPSSANNITLENNSENSNQDSTVSVADNNLEASSSSENSNLKPEDFAKHISLEEENRKLKDARLCKVCMDDEVGVVFLPCGHLVVCAQCATGMQMCPLCRSQIRGFVRTFLS